MSNNQITTSSLMIICVHFLFNGNEAVSSGAACLASVALFLVRCLRGGSEGELRAEIVALYSYLLIIIVVNGVGVVNLLVGWNFPEVYYHISWIISMMVLAYGRISAITSMMSIHYILSSAQYLLLGILAGREDGRIYAIGALIPPAICHRMVMTVPRVCWSVFAGRVFPLARAAYARVVPFFTNFTYLAPSIFFIVGFLSNFPTGRILVLGFAVSMVSSNVLAALFVGVNFYYMY